MLGERIADVLVKYILGIPQTFLASTWWTCMAASWVHRQLLGGPNDKLVDECKSSLGYVHVWKQQRRLQRKPVIRSHTPSSEKWMKPKPTSMPGSMKRWQKHNLTYQASRPPPLSQVKPLCLWSEVSWRPERRPPSFRSRWCSWVLFVPAFLSALERLFDDVTNRHKTLF